MDEQGFVIGKKTWQHLQNLWTVNMATKRFQDGRGRSKNTM